MISPINNQHQKHEKLTRPNIGEWGRSELSILGTTCDDIRHLVYKVTQQLSSLKIAYADADHKAENADEQSISAIDSGAFAEYTNKISYTQLNTNAQPNAFQKRALLNDCDLMLINGNHFSASKQILVIDDRKSLEKKLDKLTDVQLILVRKFPLEIPAFISNHLSEISSIPVFSFDDTEAIIQFMKVFVEQKIPQVNGLILAGGKSIRMGRDKSHLVYHKITQQQHLYHLLQPLCNEVCISLNEHQAKAADGMSYIRDTFLGLGPTGGILSAFQSNPNVAWLTVACDLPYLSVGIIKYLIHHRNPTKVATAFMDAENKFPEPLITIWEPKSYLVLLQFLSQGYSCPRKILINSDVELLQSPDTSAFANINTSEEYEKVRLDLH